MPFIFEHVDLCEQTFVFENVIFTFVVVLQSLLHGAEDSTSSHTPLGARTSAPGGATLPPDEPPLAQQEDLASEASTRTVNPPSTNHKPLSRLVSSDVMFALSWQPSLGRYGCAFLVTVQRNNCVNTGRNSYKANNSYTHPTSHKIYSVRFEKR